MHSRWAGTHFGRPCSSLHGSGWVCLSSSMDSRKLTFMLGGPGTAFSSLRRPYPPGCNPLWRDQVHCLALAVPFFLSNADWARSMFGAAGHVWATALCSGSPKKELVSHSSGRWSVRQIPTIKAYAKEMWNVTFQVSIALAFQIQYSPFYESEEILSID